MVIKHFGDNAITYLLGLINDKFKTKVDKVEGKDLSTNDYTTTEKNKLAGIDAGANKYTHPTHTAATEGLYKVTVDSKGHVTGTTAVAKGDITALGIPSTNTTYSNATQTKAGLMSATDKKAVDGIATTIATAIASAGHLKREKVTDLPAVANADANTIYMKSNGASGNNQFDEWMVIDGAWEKVGSSDVDLTGYLKDTDLTEYQNSEIKALWDAVFTS